MALDRPDARGDRGATGGTGVRQHALNLAGIMMGIAVPVTELRDPATVLPLGAATVAGAAFLAVWSNRGRLP